MSKISASDLDVLRAFQGQAGLALTSGELAKKAKLGTGTVHAVLTRLAREEFLTAVPFGRTQSFTLTLKGQKSAGVDFTL